MQYEWLYKVFFKYSREQNSFIVFSTSNLSSTGSAYVTLDWMKLVEKNRNIIGRIYQALCKGIEEKRYKIDLTNINV